MTDYNFSSTIFLSSMLLVFGGPARADILRCVDEDGAITYTNVSCKNIADEDSTFSGPSTVKVKVAPKFETSTDVAPSQKGDWAKKRTSNRSVALDVETIKAARDSMLMMDKASHFLARQEFVALDKRNQNWFDFH